MSFLLPFDFHKGDRLDGMTVIAPLVRGGHGDLYLVHEEVEQKLILKVIQKADNEGEFTGIEKCRAVSSHIPGLVPILKVGKLGDGRTYCVMPPADNLARWPDYEPDTLANRIRNKGRFPPDETLRIVDRILATIRDLHEAGLAHCDIKPENILFLDDAPKLTDYSLLSDAVGRPASAPSGTAGFIPPEMLGNPGCYDPKACDLYAVGKILFSMWSGTDVALFPSVPRDIPIQEIGTMLPVYMKACSVSPNERFRNAEEFISAIAGARSRLHSRFPVRGWNLPGGFAWGVLFALLAAVCTLLAAITVFFFFFRAAGRPDADPLLVTSAFDVVNANDDVNSLREALNYARFRGEQTITFRIPGSDTVYLNEPSLITSSMQFASTNGATGHPMNIVLKRLRISGRSITTPEGVEGGGAALHANGGNFVVEGGLYRENSDGGFGGMGGAIRLVNGSLTIDSATFTQNYAYSNGGAVSVENAPVTIRKSYFDGNGSVGFGGAVNMRHCKALVSDTTFVNNRTLANIIYHWMGGAIRLEESEFVYEVTAGKTITDAGNRSGMGGFIALRADDGTTSAEFRIDGVLNIGDGSGGDSFCSWSEPGPGTGPGIHEKNILIRKTGGGTMTVNASVSDYDGRWILEGGVLAFVYPAGGDFDGEFMVSGGQLRLESPYKFNSLVLRLGPRTDGPARINGLSRFAGGTLAVDATDAEDGTYPLAEGAEGFKGPVELRDASGRCSGTLAVGGSANADGFRYALDLTGGTLRLTVRKTTSVR